MWRRRWKPNSSLEFSDLFQGDRDSGFGRLLQRFEDDGVRPNGAVVGVSDEQLAEIADAQGVSLPIAYSDFMRCMGVRAGGLYRAQAIFYPHVLGMKAEAADLVEEFGIDVSLGDKLVFASHQGYIYFLMDLAKGGIDPPVLAVAETEPSVVFCADSFTQFMTDLSAD